MLNIKIAWGSNQKYKIFEKLDDWISSLHLTVEDIKFMFVCVVVSVVCSFVLFCFVDFPYTKLHFF